MFLKGPKLSGKASAKTEKEVTHSFLWLRCDRRNYVDVELCKNEDKTWATYCTGLEYLKF